MKIIIVSTITLMSFLFILSKVDAETVSKIMPEETTFDTKLLDTRSISSASSVQFNLIADDLHNSENISLWKIQTYCEDNMRIKFISSNKNNCGKSLKLNMSKANTFSFIFENKTDQDKRFTIRLKAYDTKGKWLYSSKEAFRWN